MSILRIRDENGEIQEIMALAGPQGPRGEQGPKGDKGEPGANGKDGKTPIKGFDYFTEDDKTEIAEQAADLVDVPDIDLTGYATEEFVKNKIAEAELAGGDVDLSGYAQKTDLPTKVSQLQNDKGYLISIPDEYAKKEDIPKAPADIGAQPSGDYALRSEIPEVSVQSVNGKIGEVILTASDINALPSNTKIPKNLYELVADTTHRTVTDEEKTNWNAKSNFSGSYNDLTDKPAELLNKNGILRQDVLPEGYPYVEDGLTIPEVTLYIDEETNSMAIQNAFQLVADNLYTVNYNGIEYECLAKSFTIEGIDVIVLGNISVIDGISEPTDEPFIIMNVPDYITQASGIYGFVQPLDGITEAIVKVSGKIIKKIDKSLLPDIGLKSLVDGSGLNSIRSLAASDNIGNYASAIGFRVTALGDLSHAEGSSTNNAFDYISEDSTNDEIMAAWEENDFTLAKGMGSHAEGSNTLSLGIYSHAEGGNTTAYEEYSHAEGANTRAYHMASHAEGADTIANGPSAHAEGEGTRASGSRAAHAEGYYTTALGYAHAEGTSSNKAFDYITSASTNNEIITAWEENKFTLAKDHGSHAEGSNTLAIGNSAHAEGYQNIASGKYSHAEGNENVSSGASSHTEGISNIASGDSAHAEGWATIASGDGAHAEGIGTTAESRSTHAEGENTTASGEYSHAEGLNTVAAGEAQHVQGRYNVPDTESKYAHIIGSGDSVLPRNVHTIDWYGQGWFAGGLKVGGLDDGSGSDTVATEKYVDYKVKITSDKIDTHNAENTSHNDIRLLIDDLTTRLNTLADSDDTTLDQLSEIVAYIKSNKSLIESVTTNKVNVSDIIDNLTTNVANKPLSAAQGVALKALIDAITVPTKTSQLANDSGYLTSAPVTSVNGKTGVVSLTASDVGALPSTTSIPSIAGLATETYVNTQVGTKVDKITGKGLSTNDYTNDDKAKLANTNIAYGTCSTAADVAEKVVVLTGNTQWSLTNGSIIMVKFDISNTAENVTINVNNTGAYPIWYNNAKYTSTGTAYTGYANRTIAYMFNGTHYVWITASYDSNTTYSNAGLGFGYATCSTAAATVAKTASLSSYALTTGGIVSVKFTKDVPANATLSINSKTAKNIYFRGAKITDGVIKAGDVATFVYSSYYHLISIDRWQNDITEIKSDAYKASIVDAVLEALPTWTGGSY